VKRRIVAVAVVAACVGLTSSAVTVEAAPAPAVAAPPQVAAANEGLCIDLSPLGLASICIGQLVNLGSAFAL
jgi:hypothetical protein